MPYLRLTLVVHEEQGRAGLRAEPRVGVGGERAQVVEQIAPLWQHRANDRRSPRIHREQRREKLGGIGRRREVCHLRCEPLHEREQTGNLRSLAHGGMPGRGGFGAHVDDVRALRDHLSGASQGEIDPLHTVAGCRTLCTSTIRTEFSSS